MASLFITILVFFLPISLLAQTHEIVISKSQVKEAYLKTGQEDTLFVRIKLQNPHKISDFSLTVVCSDSVLICDGFSVLRTTSNDPIDALYYFIHSTDDCNRKFGEEFRIYQYYPDFYPNGDIVFDFEITWEIILSEKLNRDILSIYCMEFYDLDEIRYLEEWRAKGNHVKRKINEEFELFLQSFIDLKRIDIKNDIIKVIPRKKKK